MIVICFYPTRHAYHLLSYQNSSTFLMEFFFSLFSARPVYLQERAYNRNNNNNNRKSGTPIADSLDRTEAWRRLGNGAPPSEKSVTPPERPPKKPHLRGDSATPPVTPPRGATPSSRPPSRSSSNATPPSRGTTPNSSVRGRPKYPSPPGSPEKTRLLPPPPIETSFDYDTPTTTTSNIQSMPLPAPPTENESRDEQKPTLR